MTVTMYSANCVKCGRPFSRRKGSLGYMKFCSRVCGRAARTIAAPAPRRGPDHPNWKGGKVSTGSYSGYKLIHTAVVGGKSKYVAEHVLVAEKALGRRLRRPDEVVHHIDGVKSNNHPSNLLICDRHYHNLIHHRMQLAWIREHILAKRVS